MEKELSVSKERKIFRRLSGIPRAVVTLLLLCLLLPISSYAQKKISVDLKNVTVDQLFKEINSKGDVKVFYSIDDLKAEKKITIRMSVATVKEILDEALKSTNLSYTVKDNTIVISPKAKVASKGTPGSIMTITGRVTDKGKLPLPGVNVLVKNTTLGTSTNVNGEYKLTIPGDGSHVLIFMFIGMTKQEYAVSTSRTLNITLEEDNIMIEDVVVTGIYSRKKESFTGSATTYSNEDIKMIGTQSVLQSLKVLDPAFNIIENNEYGSDPNRLPDIEIRGKSSIVGMKETFEADPNQPLFILDGFESSLRVISDLSVDRVASITILKDAASTAIYGAKAANGVVVVETKKPGLGKLRVGYNASLEVSMPDLSDYNLMNAREKLLFEKLSGRFESTNIITQEENMMRYNRLKAEVDRGVDTYWLSEPVRTGVNHRHDLYVDGGDDQMRYGLGINYRNTMGVMKNSERQVFGGNIDLIYRYKQVQFSNKFTMDYTSTGDPIVPYYEYAAANPYYRKTGEDGEINRYLENFKSANITGTETAKPYTVSNPMWNDSRNSFIKGTSLGLRDNFMADWTIMEGLKLSATISLSKSTSEYENFYSPEDTRFDASSILEKGSYNNSRTDNFGYEIYGTISYGKVFAEKHRLSLVGGTNFQHTSNTNKSYSALGFPKGDFTRPSFANAYPNGSPSYRENVSRSHNLYFNGGYSYDNRYLLDFNYRLDGSSVFGVNKVYTQTWAFGFAWNAHNEAFIKNNVPCISNLKLRVSVGNPGNQNFGGQQSYNTYVFDTWLQNSFGAGLIVNDYGNPDLDWQKTLDLNAGIDLSMFSNRMHVTLDVYRKRTDPLLASIGLPSSTGQTTTLTNSGIQIGEGINGTINFSPLYKPRDRKMYTISLNFRTNRSKYEQIGHKLDQFNSANKKNKNLIRYQDGASTTAMFAVPSLGIDPATGKEIFLRPDGTYTYEYEYDDEVKVGDSNPSIAGSFGNMFTYKGFSLSVFFTYSLGGDVFNNALYSKVENITRSTLANNQDKRALYNRWQKPGDISKFKGISLTESTPISSRFLDTDNYLSLSSLRVGYTFEQESLKRLGIDRLGISAYTNELFRVSSITRERGTSYPFARTMSLSLSLNF